MSRRAQSEQLAAKPDGEFGSILVGELISKIMWDGKRSLAEGIVLKAMKHASERTGISPMELLEKVLDQLKPTVEVRSRRVGGATYQVPIEVRPARSLSLALRWLVRAARKRNEKDMWRRLALEFMDVLQSRGESYRKRVEVEKMAMANLAFAHYRW